MRDNVLEYLEESARRCPDKTAFADPDESVTYAEIKERAMRIGSALAAVLPPGSPVPVLLNKSVKAVSVMLGAVYAGCFYSVLDLRQPDTRLQSILMTLDSGTAVCSRADDGGSRCLRGQQVLYYEDLLKSGIDEALLQKRRAGALNTDPLYVNFTSGSTGVPKGVVVCHRSVIDFIERFTEITGLCPDDVLGNQAPFDFDVSVKDIYSTLYLGAEMQIIPQQYFLMPTELLDFLTGRSVTVLIWAVSALTILTKLRAFSYKIPEKVRRVIFSGEVMPVRHLNMWREAVPDAVFYNVYGPTEITCNCTWYRVDRAFDQSEEIPIGKPFPNEKVFLLDEEDRLIEEAGKTGEICVAGTALALGYYRNPEATAAVFVQNPLQSAYPETIYRTGDLGTYLEDGDLLYIGRKDFQIKHMGHRIELGEIEKVLYSIREVGDACCLFIRDRIVAFYTGELTKKELVPLMKEQIPDYMVPNVFVRMEQLPLSKNGKIDRQKLKAEYSR